MKRLVALVIAGAMSLALFGCGKTNNGGKSGNDDGDKPKTTTAGAEIDSVTEDVGVDFRQKGQKAVFKVDGSLDLAEDAWMGFIPGTKGFKKEVDADELDVLYSYNCDDERKSGDQYVFEFDNDSIEALDDGDYIIVLCNTDEDTGKVLLYFPATLDGPDVTPNFDKIVIN